MSTIEPIVYDLFHKGAIFEVDLENCIDMSNFDGATVTEQVIIIYKPFGKVLIETATISEISGRFTVQYINGEDNPIPEFITILDEIGYWEYAARVKLTNNDEYQTSDRQPFYVR